MAYICGEHEVVSGDHTKVTHGTTICQKLLTSFFLLFAAAALAFIVAEIFELNLERAPSIKLAPSTDSMSGETQY